MKAVNLIPGDQRPGAGGIAGRSGGGALIVLAMLAALAVLAFVYGKSKHDIFTSRGELATANAELAADRAQAGRLAPYTTFIASANQRAQEVSQLIASRFDWSHAFSDLGRVLPRTATLTTLSGTVGAGGPAASSGPQTGATSATSATPPGTSPTFALTGCATSQSQVAVTLQRLRLMDGVTEVTLQASTKSGGAGAAAGGSSGSSGSCGPNGAAFSAQVSFQPLPATAAPATPGAAVPAGAPVSTGAASSPGAVPVTSPAGGASR
jgi:Tfp pilus assembly protein PilN